MGEQSALRELEVVGETADGEALEPELRGQAERVYQDRLSGLFTLSHPVKIVRPFVIVNPGFRRRISRGAGPAFWPHGYNEQRARARESCIANEERRNNAEEQCFHDFDVRFVSHRAVTRLSDEAVGLQTK